MQITRDLNDEYLIIAMWCNQNGLDGTTTMPNVDNSRRMIKYGAKFGQSRGFTLSMVKQIGSA